MTALSPAPTTEQRLARVEDRQAIQELGVLHGFVMDERDEAGIRRLFTDDATLDSQDGVFSAAGTEEIVTTHLGRFAALGPTNHSSHGHVVRFDDGDPDAATGLLAGPAEVFRNGVGHQVALRYEDRYRRVDGDRRSAARLMSSVYHLPSAEHAEGFGAPDSVRVYGDRRLADWPEALHSPDGSAWLRGWV